MDFNQAAFMRYFAIAVIDGWCFCVGETNKAQVEAVPHWFRLRAAQGEIDLSARIDLVGVCVIFFHGAVHSWGGQKIKGVAHVYLPLILWTALPSSAQ